jgi:hypothetical protein
LVKKRHFSAFLLALSLWVLSQAAAQKPQRVSLAIEASSCRGFLWGHTPRLTIRTGHLVLGYELGLSWPTYGRRDWEVWRCYPLWGVSACYFNLGEGAHAAAWGILPHLTVPIWRHHRWLTAFRIGTGVGYVIRPYDSFKNPAENAVGSHWNNLTQFRLGCTYRFGPRWRLQAGAMLSHLSNGAAKLPNFGINLPAYFFSLSGSPGGIDESQFRSAAAPNRAERRWGALLCGSFAQVEYAIVDGPKYAVWSASAGALFHLNRLNRLTLSLEGEYHPAVAEFGLQTGGFLSARAACSGAHRLAIAPGAEFLFGPVGIHVQAGIYTGSANINRYVPAPWYSRLSLRGYLSPIRGTNIRPCAGIALKAHRVNAETIALQVGLAY